MYGKERDTVPSSCCNVPGVLNLGMGNGHSLGGMPLRSQDLPPASLCQNCYCLLRSVYLNLPLTKSKEDIYFGTKEKRIYSKLTQGTWRGPSASNHRLTADSWARVSYSSEQRGGGNTERECRSSHWLYHFHPLQLFGLFLGGRKPGAWCWRLCILSSFRQKWWGGVS